MSRKVTAGTSWPQSAQYAERKACNLTDLAASMIVEIIAFAQRGLFPVVVPGRSPRFSENFKAKRQKPYSQVEIKRESRQAAFLKRPATTWNSASSICCHCSIESTECADVNQITISVPLNFLGHLHDQLPEGAIRDVIGQLYFGEEISPENKTALHFEGINSNLIVVHDRGN